MKKILDHFENVIYEVPEGVTLKDAIEKAVNDGVNFMGANLEGVNLDGIKLKDGCFAFANLLNASFKGASLTDINFEGSTLECANFNGAVLHSVRTVNSFWSGAYVNGAVFKNMDFDGSNIFAMSESHELNEGWKRAIAKTLGISEDTIFVRNNVKVWYCGPIHERVICIDKLPPWVYLPPGRVGSNKVLEEKK